MYLLYNRSTGLDNGFMPVDKQLVERQLEALGDFHRFFTSKEIRYLPQILAEGEAVHGITSGFFEGRTWIIVVTGVRLLFLDKGMFYGLKQVDLPLAQVSSISHKTGFLFGEIEVATSSGSRKIAKLAKRDSLKISSIISGLVHGTTGRDPAPPRNDLASQLEKLAGLRDKGALTDDEFRLSKAKLLGSSELELF